MTLFYQTNTWTSQPQPTEKTVETWKYASEKSNWRIVQLPNGFYQTEIRVPDEDYWNDITRRSTLEGAEAAIDASIAYYQKKLDFLDGPKVVKTFEKE